MNKEKNIELYHRNLQETAWSVVVVLGMFCLLVYGISFLSWVEPTTEDINARRRMGEEIQQIKNNEDVMAKKILEHSVKIFESEKHTHRYYDGKINSSNFDVNVCGGGGTDREGILWSPVGRYSLEKCNGDPEICSKKYCTWFPFISPDSMVRQGGEIPIPKNLAKGAMQEYKRLLSVSKIKYVKKDGNVWITREFDK